MRLPCCKRGHSGPPEPKGSRVGLRVKKCPLNNGQTFVASLSNPFPNGTDLAHWYQRRSHQR